MFSTSSEETFHPGPGRVCFTLTFRAFSRCCFIQSHSLNSSYTHTHTHTHRRRLVLNHARRTACSSETVRGRGPCPGTSPDDNFPGYESACSTCSRATCPPISSESNREAPASTGTLRPSSRSVSSPRVFWVSSGADICFWFSFDSRVYELIYRPQLLIKCIDRPKSPFCGAQPANKQHHTAPLSDGCTGVKGRR